MSLSITDLQQAIMATFERRGLGISDSKLLVFSDAFKTDAGKSTQWNAFKRKNGLMLADDFVATVEKIQRFLEPVYQHIALKKAPVEKQWNNSEWHNIERHREDT